MTRRASGAVVRKFAVAAGLLMCLAGCTIHGVEPSTIQKMEDVDHLSAVLPEVNDIRRRAWGDQEWCRKISSTPVDPATTSCRLVSIEVESPLIDADGAVTTLRAALKHSGVEVSWVDISNGSPTDLEVHFHLKARDFDRWSSRLPTRISPSGNVAQGVDTDCHQRKLVFPLGGLELSARSDLRLYGDALAEGLGAGVGKSCGATVLIPSSICLGEIPPNANCRT
jgi:hypothetical protein